MEADYLAVARFRKPHGLQGEAQVDALTDEPDVVFVPGRVLRPVTDDGEPVGDELVVTGARVHGRRWLLRFQGIDDRTTLESSPPRLLGARRDELRPPADDEMYLHEIPGATVVENGVEVARVKEIVGTPGSQLLLVEREGREFLIPFRPPVVRGLERKTRRIDVQLPPGIFEV